MRNIAYRGSIYPAQCDRKDHMNVVLYVGQFCASTWSFFGGLGMPPSYRKKNYRGMAAANRKITCKADLHAEDIIAIHSRLAELSGMVIKFREESINGETGVLAATKDLVADCMDAVKRKVPPFPDEAVENERQYLEEQAVE